MDVGEIKRPEEVVGYWCETLTAKDWWQSTPALDALVHQRFAATHLALSRHVGLEWRATEHAVREEGLPLTIRLVEVLRP